MAKELDYDNKSSFLINFIYFSLSSIKLLGDLPVFFLTFFFFCLLGEDIEFFFMGNAV